MMFDKKTDRTKMWECSHMVRYCLCELSTPTYDGEKPRQMITLGAL